MNTEKIVHIITQPLKQSTFQKQNVIECETKIEVDEESALLSGSKQIYDKWMQCNRKIVQSKEFLKTFSGQLTLADKNVVESLEQQYESSALKLTFEVKKVQAALNTFLIGKKALLTFLSNDKNEHKTLIDQVQKHIYDFEQILSQLNSICV